MPLMQGSERCVCGHPRDQHLQRSREHQARKSAKPPTWQEAEPTTRHGLKLAGCLLCACEAFRLERVRPLR